jgi:glutathione synthase/RimK-type ligase-like ATP-grasp enzyme
MARCVAVIANRDREQIEELKTVFAQRGASVVELPANGTLEAGHLDARAFDLVLLKLTTDAANARTFAALRGRSLRYLNSPRSVKLCQSRRATFAFAQRHARDVATPRFFVTAVEARRAIAEGLAVWVRRDAHNIPLGERVLGVAHAAPELDALVRGRDPRTLFFQEYLGDSYETRKAYVVGTDVVVVRRTEEGNHVRVESVATPQDVIAAILRIGSAFGMSVYGVDFFHRGGEAVCLDVNDFPSFRGIPGASQRICELAENECS